MGNRKVEKNPMKVMTIFGTRPEAIKMAPIIKCMEDDDRFESIVTVTAQHRQMLDQVLDFFEIIPDFDLDIMTPNQTLSSITSKILLELDQVFSKIRPDIILVHGDTTTTFAAGLSAFYHKIKIGHVEAGLRTGDIATPYPEEANRQLTDILSDIYFAPTLNNKANLLKEGKDESRIFLTGNTVVDTLKYTRNESFSMSDIDFNKKILLVTMHRRENIGEPMKQVFQTLNRIAKQYEDVQIVFPVHKNPKVRELVESTLDLSNNVVLIEPLDVMTFHNLARESYLILSDSGGIQEEAPSFGVPIVVLRESTERPEGIEAGTSVLAGTDEKKLFEIISALLTKTDQYKEIVNKSNPYGDGYASQRILDILAYEFGRSNELPAPFFVKPKVGCGE